MCWSLDFFEEQSFRKRLIGRIFTHTFAVVCQINPGLDSPLRLFFIVTTINKMTTDQYWSKSTLISAGQTDNRFWGMFTCINLTVKYNPVLSIIVY